MSDNNPFRRQLSRRRLLQGVPDLPDDCAFGGMSLRRRGPPAARSSSAPSPMAA